MFESLRSVPWVVVALFAGTALIALAAGRRLMKEEGGGGAMVAATVHAVVVGVIIALWLAEQS